MNTCFKALKNRQKIGILKDNGEAYSSSTHRQKEEAMYYSSGNFEAYAKPEKPEGIEKKQVYIVGSGMASLSAALFLLRDGQMPGKNIHIMEKASYPGAAVEGYEGKESGYVLEGCRDLDANFEPLWDLLRSVPSLDDPEISVLDETYRITKADPNYSLVRSTSQCGKVQNTDFRLNLNDHQADELMKLFVTHDAELFDKEIKDVLSEDTLATNFWMYYRTIFGFENHHSALELKKSFHRYMHNLDKIPDMSSSIYTKYNQYESMILPIVKHLENNGVDFVCNTVVTDVKFDITPEAKVAKEMTLRTKDGEKTQELGQDDYLLVTIGGCTANATMGSQTKPAEYVTDISRGGAWSLWQKIAVQDNQFGNPAKFYSYPEKTRWVCATITTTDEKIPPYIKSIARRDPFNGKTVTGGHITVEDSNWFLSWSFNRQPQFRSQKENELVGWIYGMNVDVPGNYIKKPMIQCTGEEICMEWLYHIGVPTEEIPKLASESAVTNPCIVPFITSYFLPCATGDRPKAVPDGAKNFGFIGQYARTERDVCATTEYSVRTSMEAVYTLFEIDRAVPEVWGGVYDIREILTAISTLREGRSLPEIKRSYKIKLAVKELLKHAKDTDVYRLLQEAELVKDKPNKR